MTATTLKLIVNIWNDDCAEDPCDMDGWKVHSFGRHHHNAAQPKSIGFDFNDDAGCYKPDKALQAKLDSGLAFYLDYFEHGQCKWSLSGEGPQCRWDSVSHAGILIWDGEEGVQGGATREEREHDARIFIDNYTAWCNGYVYGFNIDVVRACGECHQDKEVPDDEHNVETVGCGGFMLDSGDYDALGYMIEAIKENIGPDWADYEVTFKEENAYGVADEIKSCWEEQQ